MRRYLCIPLFFILISALTSFGFIASVLVTQVGQDSYISPFQLYAVIAISTVATLSSAGLLALAVLELVGKRVAIAVHHVASYVVMAIGLIFCGLTAWSFYLAPTDFYEDFLLKFTHSARFEFLMIGISALAIIGIWRLPNTASK